MARLSPAFRKTQRGDGSSSCHGEVPGGGGEAVRTEEEPKTPKQTNKMRFIPSVKYSSAAKRNEVHTGYSMDMPQYTMLKERSQMQWIHTVYCHLCEMSRISKYAGIKNGFVVGRAGRMEEWEWLLT